MYLFICFYATGRTFRHLLCTLCYIKVSSNIIVIFYYFIVTLYCVYTLHIVPIIYLIIAMILPLIGNKHICICIYIQSKKKWNGLNWTFSYSRLIKMGEGTIVIKRNVKSTISFKMVCKFKHFSLQRAGVVNNTKKLKNLISVTDPTCNKFNLHDRRKHW